MLICRGKIGSETCLSPFILTPSQSYRIAITLSCLFLLMGTVHAQTSNSANSTEDSIVVGNVSKGIVFGMGKSVRITGTVKQGAISFGGDVVVEGTVEGDVAAIGGSVVQADNARIGGDVIVLGGVYSHGDKAP